MQTIKDEKETKKAIKNIAAKAVKKSLEKKDVKAIDFTKVDVKNLEGQTIVCDLSKILSNFIYNNTGEILLLDVLKDIRKGKPVVLTPEMKAEFLRILHYKEGVPFIAIVKLRLFELLK